MDSIEIKSPTERYKAIADAIREKNGTTELMHPADMPQAILDIVSGGTSLPELSKDILYWNSFCLDDKTVNDVNYTLYPAESVPFTSNIGGWDVTFASYSSCLEISFNEQKNNVSVGCWLKWKGQRGTYQRMVSIHANNKSGWYCPLFIYSTFTHDNLNGFSVQEIVTPDLSDGEYHYFSCIVATENGTTTIREYWDNVLCYLITGDAIDYITKIKISDVSYPFNAFVKNLWIADGVLSEEELITMSKVTVNADIQSGTSKEEQEKTIDITENGTTEVLPDEGKVLGKVTVNVDVSDGTEELEQYYKASYWLTFNNTSSPFYNSNWSDTTIPKMDYSRQTSLSYGFSSPSIERIEHYINSSNCQNFSSAFSGRNIVYIKGVDTSNATSVKYTFGTAVKVIEEPLNLQNVTTSNNMYPIFNGHIREVRFVSETIKVSIVITSQQLTTESVESIVGGLATLEEGATAQTLTLSRIFENDFEKLPAELRDLITNQKGWTLGFA